MPSLTLQILYGNDTILSSFEFYPGEDVELRSQIIEQETEQQWLLPTFPKPSLSFILPGNPSNITIPNGDIEIDEDNRSIVKILLSDAVTTTLTSGNLRLIMDIGTDVVAANLTNLTTAQSAKLTVNGVDYPFTSNGASDGTFLVADSGVLERGDLGTVSDNNTAAMNVAVMDLVPSGGQTLVRVGTYTVETRMAQVRNALRRLTPNPVG